MNQTDLQGETERALRAVAEKIGERYSHFVNKRALAKTITAELLPLFNAGMEQANKTSAVVFAKMVTVGASYQRLQKAAEQAVLNMVTAMELDTHSTDCACYGCNLRRVTTDHSSDGNAEEGAKLIEKARNEQDERWVDAMGWTDLVHDGPYTQSDRERYVKLLVDSVTYNMHEEAPPEQIATAVAGAYAAAAESFIKAQEEWHKTSGIPATRERGCNCYGDDKTDSHASGCPRRIAAKILALTLADARQAQDENDKIVAMNARHELNQRIGEFTGQDANSMSTFQMLQSWQVLAIASAEARARLETAKLRDALEEIAHEPLGSHATKQVAIEALRDSQVAKSIVDEWREDETGRVYVHKDAILKAINATIWQLTFLLDHSYNVPKDWRKRMAARAPDSTKEPE